MVERHARIGLLAVGGLRIISRLNCKHRGALIFVGVLTIKCAVPGVNEYDRVAARQFYRGSR